MKITPAEARSRLAAIALSQVGKREVGGNNVGPAVRMYQSSTWLEPAAWPWCAAFVCWCIREWLKDPQVLELLGMTPKQAEKWRPKTAGAYDFANWAKKQGLKTLSEKAEALTGDLIIFDFSHIGIVTDQMKGVRRTVEGNTNGQGDRDSTSGDGVWKKTRADSLARTLIRIL
jgi:hypothetical protein